MASRIIEFFGYAPTDSSEKAEKARQERYCPFIKTACQKTLNDGSPSGACTLQAVRGAPVICCPIRLYANGYQILKDVGEAAFGEPVDLYSGSLAKEAAHVDGRARIAVFGKGWGGELRVPNRGRSGGYYVDWVLARLNKAGGLQDFAAIEVQSIDTTGTYRNERDAYLKGRDFKENSTAGFNWENVNKRILPQLIYKGHVLHQERLCTSGLFFVCPSPVFRKIHERLGGKLKEFDKPHQGALTFMWYDVEQAQKDGEMRGLKKEGQFTTSVELVARALTEPDNLPDKNVYEQAILAELSN